MSDHDLSGVSDVPAAAADQSPASSPEQKPDEQQEPSSDVSWQPESPGSRPGSANNAAAAAGPGPAADNYVVGDDDEPASSPAGVPPRTSSSSSSPSSPVKQRSRPGTGGSVRAGANSARSTNRASSAGSSRCSRTERDGAGLDLDSNDESTTILASQMQANIIDNSSSNNNNNDTQNSDRPNSAGSSSSPHQQQQHHARPSPLQPDRGVNTTSGSGFDERSPQRAGANTSAGAADPNTESVMSFWRSHWQTAFNLQRQCADESMHASTRRRRKMAQQKRTRSEIAAAQMMPRVLSPAAMGMLHEREKREEAKQKKAFWGNRVTLLKREVEREKHMQEQLRKAEAEKKRRIELEQQDMKWEEWHASLYDRRTRLTSQAAIAASETAQSGGSVRNPHHEQLRTKHLQTLKETLDRSFQQKHEEWLSQRAEEGRRRQVAERMRADDRKERKIRVQITRASDMAAKEKRFQREEELRRQSRENYIQKMEQESQQRKEFDGDTKESIQKSHDLVDQIRKLRRARAKMEERIGSMKSPERSFSTPSRGGSAGVGPRGSSANASRATPAAAAASSSSDP